MSLSSESVLFIVDSGSSKAKGTTGNFQYELNIPRGHDFDRVCVLQAIIPKSYYLIRVPYNSFTLLEDGVYTDIAITPGNYNVKSWITIISSLLTSSSSQGWIYNMSFPNPITQVDTGLITYSVSGNSSQPSFIFPLTSLVHEQFGFNLGSENIFSGDTLISKNVVKFQVEDVIFIHSDISSNNDMSEKNDVLQEIYASSTPNFSNIIYQNSGAIEAYSKKLTTSDSNSYKFVFTDEKENEMDFNGQNSVFTLLVYKKDNINQLIAKNLLSNSY